MTLGWHLDRAERRARGEKLTWWPEAVVALLVGGPALAAAIGLVGVAAALLVAGKP